MKLKTKSADKIISLPLVQTLNVKYFDIHKAICMVYNCSNIHEATVFETQF